MTLEELIIKIRASATGVSATMAKTKADVKGVEDQATKSKGVLGGIFAGVPASAGVAAAGIVAGAAVVGKSIETYKAYNKEVKAMMRSTNATAEQASTIVGQMKLIGGEDLNTADALGRWAVNLYAARDAASTQGKVMAKLGIDLKDQNGAWRNGADVLMEYRDKMSGVDDATQRASDLQVMMGRGYRNILPWFTKSTDEIEEQTKALKDMGMVMSEEDMNTWGKYMGDEKMMSMLMTALQVKIARLVIPTLNAVFPLLNTFIGYLTKVPAPIIKIVAGLGMLWAAMKLGGAAIQMGRNISTAMRAVSGMTGTTSRLVRLFGPLVDGFRSERVAASALSGPMGTLGGKMRGLVSAVANAVTGFAKYIAKVPAMIAANVGLSASYLAVAAAAAAAGFAIYEAVKAFQSWREAVEQADTDANNAAAQNEKAYQTGGITKEQYEQNKAGIEKDRYQADWWAKPSNWISNLVGLAGGGEIEGPQSGYPVMLHGKERVTPLGKEKAGRPVVINVAASFIDMPTKAQLRKLGKALGDEFVSQVIMTEAGANA